MAPSGFDGDGTLAEGVLCLAQTLTKNNAMLRERTEERARLTKIVAEFRKHLSWQGQRTTTLKRNLERLHNESNWLSTKSDEVRQDAHVVSHELRQATYEVRRASPPVARTGPLSSLPTPATPPPPLPTPPHPQYSNPYPARRSSRSCRRPATRGGRSSPTSRPRSSSNRMPPPRSTPSARRPTRRSRRTHASATGGGPRRTALRPRRAS